MLLAKVTATVVATVKHEVLNGRKLLLVQPVGPDGMAKGKAVLAVDAVQAGVGDMVLVLDEGNSGRMMMGDPAAPVRTVVVGIVDRVSREGGEEDGH